MADRFARRGVPASSASTSLAELHQLCRADYTQGQSQRATPTPAQSYTAAPLAAPGPVTEHVDLTVAIGVAQKMLTAYSDTSTFGEFGYAQAHGALSESLRLLLRALGAEADLAGTTPGEVRHANGLAFKVIDGSSPYARIARNVRQLVMADGSEWTVGAPVGWFGIEAAWRPAPDQPASTPEQPYGGDVDQFISDAYDSLADSDLDAEPVDEDEAARRSVDRAFPVVSAFLAAERGEGL